MELTKLEMLSEIERLKTELQNSDYKILKQIENNSYSDEDFKKIKEERENSRENIRRYKEILDGT